MKVYYKGYWVEDDGTIYGKKGFPRKVQMRPDGYLQLTIHDPETYSKRINYMHHRFVYEAFNGPIEGDFHVDHIDEVRHHNYLSNLQLLTPKENIQKRFRNG